MAKKFPRRTEWALGKRFRGWVARAQNGRCASCGYPLNLSKSVKPTHSDAPTVDHVYAKSNGGSRHLDNVIVMHRKCNGKKGNRPPNGCELIWSSVVQAKIEAQFGPRGRAGV